MTEIKVMKTREQDVLWKCSGMPSAGESETKLLQRQEAKL